MQVDPQLWSLIAPLLVGMTWAYTRTGDHAVKRMWQELVRLDAEIWTRVAGMELDAGQRQLRVVHNAVYWSVKTLLVAFAVVSFLRSRSL